MGLEEWDSGIATLGLCDLRLGYGYLRTCGLPEFLNVAQP